METEEILLAIVKKSREFADVNTEIAIFYDENWRIDFGNPSSAVMLGEVEGSISVIGETLAGAIEKLDKAVDEAIILSANTGLQIESN